MHALTVSVVGTAGGGARVGWGGFGWRSVLARGAIQAAICSTDWQPFALMHLACLVGTAMAAWLCWRTVRRCCRCLRRCRQGRQWPTPPPWPRPQSATARAASALGRSHPLLQSEPRQRGPPAVRAQATQTEAALRQPSPARRETAVQAMARRAGEQAASCKQPLTQR